MICGPRLQRGLALAVLLLTAGCAESVYLASRPPGATVTINGERVGRTPMLYSVVPAKWDPPFHYRVEKPGYEPAEGTLATGVSDGRVIGGVLSLGLSLFFKQPDTFLQEEYFFELQPSSSAPKSQRPPAAPRRTPRRFRPVPQPPPVPYEPPAAHPERPRGPSTRERLSPPPAPRPAPTPAPAEPRLPPPAPTASAVPTEAAPPADEAASEVQRELDRLRQLRDDGIIIDAEYEQLRDSLLKGQ